jgi:hypothetical protein
MDKVQLTVADESRSRKIAAADNTDNRVQMVEQ